MRKLLIVAIAICTCAVVLRAQPPDPALPAAWDELKTLELTTTALPVKTKELIAVAVAAQIPCRSCVHAQMQLAKASGATDREVREAIRIAAITWRWTTMIVGTQIEPDAFDREVAAIMSHMTNAAYGTPVPASEPVMDAASAYREIERTFGTVPAWLRAFPPVIIAPAWRELADLQLDPTTALDGKTKELIALAVAAQIPSRFGVSLHAQGAKLNGAVDDELDEAIAIAALTRELGTVVDGALVDEHQLRRDVDAAVRNLRAKEQKVPATARR